MIDFSVYYPQKKDVYARKCPGCSTLYYPVPMICGKCHSRRDPSGVFFPAWEKVGLSGLRGKLITWTKLFNLPKGFNQRYLLFGIAELENGLRVTGRLGFENPKSGIEVVAGVGLVREKVDEDVYGFIFELP